MNRSLPRLAVLGAAVIGFTLCSAAYAWTYRGTAPLQAWSTPYASNPDGSLVRPLPNLHTYGDSRRPRFFSLVVDNAGNAFGTTHATNGGVTMWPAGGGSPVTFASSLAGPGSETVNWTTANGTPCSRTYNRNGGDVTKLVLGGDGKVYGVQNYYELGGDGFPPNMDSGKTSRMLRFNTNGSIDTIVDYHPRLASIALDGTDANACDNYGERQWSNIIGGLTVGSDGNVYYWLGGPSNSITYNGEGQYFKKHILWRYNVSTQVIEESPTSDPATRLTYACGGGSYNESFEQTARILCLEWIGKDGANGNADTFGIFFPNLAGIDRKSWLTCRGTASPVTNNDLRHTYPFSTAFDPIRQKLWIGPMNTTGFGSNASGVDGYGSVLFERWNGQPNTGLFTSVDLWHANGNYPGDLAPFTPGLVGNGSLYWVTGLAVSLGDGRAYMSWGGRVGSNTKPGDGNYTQPGPYGRFGHVYSVEPDKDIFTSTNVNMGRPMDDLGTSPYVAELNHESIVASIAMGGKNIYAMVVDMVNGRYHLFSMTNPGPTCNAVWADSDSDGDVDLDDFGAFQACYTGDSGAGFNASKCYCFDRSFAQKVTDNDFAKFTNCATRAGVTTIPPTCN